MSLAVTCHLRKRTPGILTLSHARAASRPGPQAGRATACDPGVVQQAPWAHAVLSHNNGAEFAGCYGQMPSPVRPH